MNFFCHGQRNNFADEPCPISLLPVELLSALMRYVVGSGLDVRCLEILSMTSVGFYLLARFVFPIICSFNRFVLRE